MKLVIVESPTKAKTLKKFLGADYHIEASMGHIRDLPKNKLGVDIAHDFEPEYVKSEGKTKTISTLKKYSQDAEMIYLATDPDREGEAISWHIQTLLQEKKKGSGAKFVRATFHEITPSAIKHAIDNPGTLNMALVDAQQARRVVDRLVGYYLSPVLWKKIRRGLSAGRVQSVALRLIVEREREILAFVPEEYWEVYVNLLAQKSPDDKVTVQLWKVNGKEFAAKSKTEVDPILADLNTSSYTISDVEAVKRKRQSLPPFTTSTLQQAASNRLGFSSKKTMKLAQDLYEQGFITYHRTDSVNLAASALDAARGYIQTQFGDQYLPGQPRVFQTKSKNAQEAHEAIRPTEVNRQEVIEGSQGKLEQDHARLYDLIWRRFLASQMADAIYDQTTILVEARPNGKTVYILKATGSVLLFEGWTKLFPNSTDVVLPKLAVGEVMTKESIDAQQKFTQPKPRYNDASLVKTLEKLGIGRPSTYASIISVLELRGYVERAAKAFVPTAIGMAVCDFLVQHFPKTLDYAFTAGMEDDLDAIARGEKPWADVIKTFFGPFEKTVASVTDTADRAKIPVEELGKECPNCHEGKLVIRTGRFGKFVSCNRYPGCTFTAKLVQRVEGVKCPECGEGDILLKKGARGREFFGCSKYPACTYTTWQKPGTVENPIVVGYIPNAPRDPNAPKKAVAKKVAPKKTPTKKAAPKKATGKTAKKTSAKAN